MKYSIDDLRKLQPVDNNIRVIDIPKKQLELDALTSEKAAATESYNAAIIEKDMDAATEAKARVLVIDELIKAKEAEISALEAAANTQSKKYSREDVKTSWNEYIAKNNTLFKEKHNKFLAARKELAALFLELAEMQRKAIIDACKVNRLYSETNPSMDALQAVDSDLDRPETLESYPNTVNGFELIPCGIRGFTQQPVTYHKDLLISALIAAGEIPEDKQADLVSVIDFGKPVNKSI